jgi:hypothetical protein
MSTKDNLDAKDNSGAKDNWDDSDEEGDDAPLQAAKGDDLLRFELYKPEDIVAPVETDEEEEDYPQAEHKEVVVASAAEEDYLEDYESDEYDVYEDQIDKKLGRYVSCR